MASQLKRECASDTTYADDGDSQLRRWKATDPLNHHESMIEEGGADFNHAKSNFYAAESKE